MKIFEKAGVENPDIKWRDEWRAEFQRLLTAHTKLLHEHGALTGLYNMLEAEKHNARCRGVPAFDPGSISLTPPDSFAEEVMKANQKMRDEQKAREALEAMKRDAAFQEAARLGSTVTIREMENYVSKALDNLDNLNIVQLREKLSTAPKDRLEGPEDCRLARVWDITTAISKRDQANMDFLQGTRDKVNALERELKTHTAFSDSQHKGIASFESDLQQKVGKLEVELIKEREATRTVVSGANNALRQRDEEIRDLQERMKRVEMTPLKTAGCDHAHRLGALQASLVDRNMALTDTRNRLAVLEDITAGLKYKEEGNKKFRSIVRQLLRRFCLKVQETPAEEREVTLVEEPKV